MSGIRFTEEHFTALDVACGAGLELDIDGKTWTFSPNTFRDARKIMVRARAAALEAYGAGTKGADIGFTQRAIDINTILFGVAPQAAFTDPGTRRYQMELSLRHTHTMEPDAEIQKVLDKIFDDEEMAEKMITVVNTMTHGPFTKDDLTPAEGDGAENPTEPAPKQAP